MYARYIPPPKTRSKEAATSDFLPASTAPTAASPSGQPYARYIPPPKATSDLPSLPKKIVFTEDDFPTPEPKKRKHDEDDEQKPRKEKKSKKSKESKSPKDGSSQNDAVPVTKDEKLEDDKEHASPSPGTKTQEKDKKNKERKTEKKNKKKRSVEADDQTALDAPPDASLSAEQPLEPVAENVIEQTHAEDATEDLRKDAKKKERKKKKKHGKDAQDDVDGSDLDADKSLSRHKAVLEKKKKSISRAKELSISQQLESEDATGLEGQSEKLPEPVEVHGLEPLPQPTPIHFDPNPTYETLPPWLASPIRVSADTITPFTDLGIGAEAAKILESKGYSHAFAVQTAAIPLLIPTADRQGDLAISAATGSGKTLAYVLPMVRDISQSTVTRLRGLIIVPTRELVAQVQAACEICAGAFAGSDRKRVKVGVSVGSQNFEQEQAVLVGEEQQYNPAGYEEYLKKQQRLFSQNGFADGLSDLLDKRTTPLPFHTVESMSKVDILICTTGRLVEHMQKTPGFTLDYVRWFIVDEADKLLAQSFQGWLELVIPKLSIDKPGGARNFPNSNKSGVRKVVLSATMTRDLTLLNDLKLRRPKLIVLEGTTAGEDEGETSSVEHTLPEFLAESAIKVRDPNLKPLYLVDLLESKYITPINVDKQMADVQSSGDEEEDSESEESDTESESDSSDSDADLPPPRTATATTASTASQSPPSLTTTVLIFTKSNETALRLSRLLAILIPALGPHIGSLTSTARASQRRRTLRAFAARRLRILVASDLVARGIDIPLLDHVINYDIPTSVASYVHRVGRTARAGKAGHAWTFVTNTEAGWFFRDVGGEGKGASKAIKRTYSGRIERIRSDDVGSAPEAESGQQFSEERIREYESALEQLGSEAREARRKQR